MSFDVAKIFGMAYVTDTAKTWKVLTGDAPNATSLTVHDSQGTDYQVPAAKTFTMAGLRHIPQTTDRMATIFQADDVDGTTNQIIKFMTRSDIQANPLDVPIPELVTFASSKYINWKVDNTSGAGKIVIFGFES